MYLKKLEIYGFKSFAEKTEISFDKGVTSIVGPNGTGKSNVADAVRWVLGEQSAKSLRTQRMDDVIFGGTENRKPLSYCEVSLTFDNADGELRIDFTEVTVTRRAYRTGESEYLINQNQCRLRDISELFRDTGIGKEGYSMIGQGRIDEVLSTRPEERRTVLEEAAGIGKYRARKEEAERKLSAAEQDVVRIVDVITELERQLGPLEKQCEETRRYITLKERLKELELSLFLVRYDQGKEKLESTRNMVQGLAEQCGSKLREEAQLNSDLARLETESAERENAIQQLREKTNGITAEISKTNTDKSIALERVQSLRDEQERLKSELARNDASRDALEKERDGRRTQSTAASDAITELCKQLEEHQSQHKEMADGITSKGHQMDELQAVIKGSMERLYEEKNKVAGMEASRNASVSRLKQLETRRDALLASISAYREQESNCRKAIDRLAAELRKQVEARNAAIQTANELTLKTSQMNQASNNLVIRIGESESRLKMLENMQREYEGYSSTVRSLLKDSDSHPELKKRILGAVAQVITVPAEYRSAVEMALGPALNNIITENEEDAKYLIEHLRNNNLGRATFLPLASIKPKVFSQQECAAMKINGFKGIASEVISYDGKYAPAIQSLLARTAIVDNMDAGIELARKTAYTFRIVTLKGDIINAGGSMTGGSTGGRSASLLGRQDTIEEIRKAKAGYEKQMADLAREKEGVALELQKTTDEIRCADQTIRQTEIAEATEKERRISISKSIESGEGELQNLGEEKSRIETDLKAADNTLIYTGSVSDELMKTIEVKQEEERNLKKEYDALMQQREDILQHIASIRIKIAEMEKEADAQKNFAERTSLEIQNLLRDSDEKNKNLETNAGRIEEQLALIAVFEKRIGELDKTRQDIEKEIGGYEQNRRNHLNKSQSLLDRRAQIQSQIEQTRERSHKLELSLTKLESDIDNMTAKIWDEYELTYLGAEKFRLQTIPEDAPNQIDSIRRTLRTMSNINPNAIEDYNNVKERYDYLSSQRDDLAKAQTDLQHLIDDLTQKMKKQFREQFELININFAQTFKQLFGGGKATLVLGDENDIMDCSIDIIAQPPGKNLKLISLSGGEKTLTAIALLFAILKLKPTPFCLLDEIDAALDEANTERFSSYIKDFARKTQFILITHRRATMANSEIIYGMAMEEKGVSKMVSVRLEREAAS